MIAIAHAPTWVPDFLMQCVQGCPGVGLLLHANFARRTHDSKVAKETFRDPCLDAVCYQLTLVLLLLTAAASKTNHIGVSN